MATPLNILVVEDHDGLRDVTVEILGAQGHVVTGLDCAEAVAELPASWKCDIAILDLNLPGEDGLALASRLRTMQPGIGIVMVTVRHALDEKLAGYEHGADLYLTKPTAPEELCAAVQALARRIGLTASIPVADFVLDMPARVLRTPAGSIGLRSSEASVLHALARAPEQLLEAWQLLLILEKPDDTQGKAQLEVLISRLRGKLTRHGAPSNVLRAERGKGYRLCLALKLI